MENICICVFSCFVMIHVKMCRNLSWWVMWLMSSSGEMRNLFINSAQDKNMSPVSGLRRGNGTARRRTQCRRGHWTLQRVQRCRLQENTIRPECDTGGVRTSKHPQAPWVFDCRPLTSMSRPLPEMMERYRQKLISTLYTTGIKQTWKNVDSAQSRIKVDLVQGWN